MSELRTMAPVVEVNRVRLDLDDDPVDVLRRFRGRDRLVALFGDWAHGEALIACDPVRIARDPFEGLDVPFDETPGEGFTGGWIGVWGYRIAHRLESVPQPPARPVAQPDHRVAFYDRVLRRTDGVWWIESIGPTDHSDIQEWLSLPAAALPFRLGEFAMTPEPAIHQASVARALEHIAAGDAFQVNLCSRFETELSGDPLDLFCSGYTALKPAYAAYVAAPEGVVASFSPELFLRRTGQDVMSSPIKGTASLDTEPLDLMASDKDRAENLMIVDLMRNDLSRVCVPGSVQVPALARPERHAVWHLVSDVVGRLEHGITDADLLRATFPPGSVTGAPKVRAMEIAAQLEPTGREAYTGAIGRVSSSAGMELSVAIRTFEIAGGRIWLGVGGGIVADSTPEGEYEEVLVKAGPLIEAIGGTLDLGAIPQESSTRQVAASSPRTGALSAMTLAGSPAASGVNPPTARVLFIDNYDSFVHNLVHYTRELGARADVIRNDAATVAELVRDVKDGGFTHVVVSPGPGRPADAGISIEAVLALGPLVPVLGICLGHQAIAEAYGGRITRASAPMHGKQSAIYHDGAGLLAGLPSPTPSARYHSLIVAEEGLPDALVVTARTESGVIMGLQHRTLPTHGLQIHPESILTPHGREMMRAFVAI